MNYRTAAPPHNYFIINELQARFCLPFPTACRSAFSFVPCRGKRRHENFRTETIKPKIIFTPGTELKAEMEKISYKIES